MKKFLKVIVLSTFISANALPVLVAAQVRGGAANGTSTGKGGGEAAFCTNLATRATEWIDRFSSHLDDLKSKETTRESKRSDAANKHMADLAQKRAERETELSAHTAKLNDRAQSDAQKAAISAFQSAVQAAIQARRMAVDAALDAFHKGIAGALTARKTAVEKALNDFTSAFKAAADKAKADCATGVSPRTVRTTFTSAVKTARQNLAAARKAGNNFGETMKGLIAAKKTAFDKAQKDFKAALEKAKADLKATIGSQKPTSTTP